MKKSPHTLYHSTFRIYLEMFFFIHHYCSLLALPFRFSPVPARCVFAVPEVIFLVRTVVIHPHAKSALINLAGHRVCFSWKRRENRHFGQWICKQLYMHRSTSSSNLLGEQVEKQSWDRGRTLSSESCVFFLLFIWVALEVRDLHNFIV